MPTGTAIFLSSLFVGTIALFIATRDRWNWRKIRNRALIALGALVAIGVTAAVSIISYERWHDRPQVVTSLRGISVGEKFSDVVFKHGSFEKYEVPKGVVQKYADQVTYRQIDARLAVHVRNGSVMWIAYRCKDDVSSTTVNGIACNDSGDKIRRKFGAKIRVLCRTQKTEESDALRAYDVIEYGTRYILSVNQVQGFLVMDKDELGSLIGYNWDKCN